MAELWKKENATLNKRGMRIESTSSLSGWRWEGGGNLVIARGREERAASVLTRHGRTVNRPLWATDYTPRAWARVRLHCVWGVHEPKGPISRSHRTLFQLQCRMLEQIWYQVNCIILIKDGERQFSCINSSRKMFLNTQWHSNYFPISILWIKTLFFLPLLVETAWYAYLSNSHTELALRTGS